MLSIVQFPVDGIDNLLIGFVDQILVQDHMQLLLDHAGGGDTGNTRDTFQFIDQRIVEKLCQLNGIFSCHGHRRHFYRQHRGIDLQHIRRTDHIIPLTGERHDLLLDVHADGIHIHGLFELQHNGADILTGSGTDFLDMLQSGHSLLKRFGHFLLHFLRCGTRIGSHNDHIGKVHIGQQIRGHLKIGNNAQHKHGNHRHKDGHGFFYGKFMHRQLLTNEKHIISR